MPVSARPVPAIVDEATKRSAVVWLAVPGGGQPQVLWQLWQGGVSYVVTGGGEQPWPGDPAATTAVVLVRSKDRGSDLLVSWEAVVALVLPGSARWDEVVPALHAKKMNRIDGEAQPERWARDCVVRSLTPTGVLLDD